MPLEPGTSLGHYEILSPLGKGGMGEVFRARDTKLGREVALKVLPDEFTSDTERLARFEREARVLASLDHPHVASIHGFEDVGGVRFLVMQLAAGEDLSDRLKRGPVPLAETLAIAGQIAQALEAAHEQGVVHRDLKPANVKLDEDGNVKVLDFGLAKAFEDEALDEGLSNSPTLVRAATHAGVILGTAAYMSPEQARGRRVDKRADIWAFGVVVWEMLTGAQMFSGETVSDTLAAVLMRQPDLSALPSDTPPSLRWVLARCLEPDPKKRLRDIGEARLAIDTARDEPAEAGPGAGSVGPTRRYAPWAVVAVLLAALGYVLARAPGPTPSASPAPIAARLAVFDQETLRPDGGSSVVISPDGRVLVYVAAGNEGRQLFKQRMDEVGVVPIPGTRGAEAPFFSPDGQWVAFFTGHQLKKVATSGGVPLAICDVVAPRGGSWGESGFIVLAPNLSSGLFLVSENGGVPEPLTTPDPARSERSHRWPQFLPGGRAVVFMAQKEGGNYDDALIEAVSIETRNTTLVHAGGSYPRYARSGHLLYSRGGVLFAVSFDAAALEAKGPPGPVLQELFSRTGNEASDDGTAHYDVSSDGTLAYRRGRSSSARSRIAVVDRDNRRIATSRPGQYLSPALSPDATRVAVEIESESGANVWVWDIARDTLNRLTFGAGHDQEPVWSPDGTRLAYDAKRDEGSGTTSQHLFVKPADGSGQEVSLAGPDWNGRITSWSADGRTLIYHGMAEPGIIDIGALSIAGEDAGTSRPIIDTPAVEYFGDISPDGRLLAYQSNESGEFQIYVRPLSGPDGKWQVSVDGGSEPSWTRGGREIVWRNADAGLAAATVATQGSSLVIGRPTPLLFEGRYIALFPRRLWDVSNDGETFVFLEADQEVEVEGKTIVLMTDWFDELNRLAPLP